MPMQDDLFPDDPRRPPPPDDAERSVLEYASHRLKGITLHGILRDLQMGHKQAANLLTEMSGKGMIEATGKKRNGCNIYLLSNAGRCLLDMHI